MHVFSMCHVPSEHGGSWHSATPYPLWLLNAFLPFYNPLSALFYHPFTQNCQVGGPLPCPISQALNFSKPSLLIMWPSCPFLILRIIIILLLSHSQKKEKRKKVTCVIVHSLNFSKQWNMNYLIIIFCLILLCSIILDSQFGRDSF